MTTSNYTSLTAIGTTKLAQLATQSDSVNSHTSHTNSTDLSWDGQFLILRLQWRKEVVERPGDLAVEDREKG